MLVGPWLRLASSSSCHLLRTAQLVQCCTLIDPPLAHAPYTPPHPHICEHTAEMCAERLGISREAQDAHAVESAERAQRATAEGLAAWEVAPVEVAAKGGGKRVVKEVSRHLLLFC